MHRFLHCHWRALSPLFAVAFAMLPLGSAGRAVACPFCSAVSLTFAQEIEQSSAAVIARLVEPPPAAALGPAAEGPLPKGRFEVIEVLKGQNLLADDDGLEIEAIMLEEKPVGSLFLLMGIEPPAMVWSSPIAINERVVEYLRSLASLPPSGPDRLAFFQKYLEDADQILARDAYDEFAVAAYDDVRGLEDRMDPTQLLAWIRDPAVQSTRRRLYATMLGVCGTPADAQAIKEILAADDDSSVAPEVRTGLDALIACYVTLAGPEGLDLIDRLFLDRRGDREVPFTETYAAVMALRFLGEESEIVPRKRVLASLRLLLEEPKLADLVIADLARWQDWSVVERLAGLFRDATPETIFVREPIVNYLQACPLPEAKQALEACRTIDPEAVRRAATLAGFAAVIPPAGGAGGGADGGEGATRPPRGPSDEDLALADRVAPVLADEDATDDIAAVDPSETASTVEEGDSFPAARWAIWAAVVILVGLTARRILVGSGGTQR